MFFFRRHPAALSFHGTLNAGFFNCEEQGAREGNLLEVNERGHMIH